MIADRIPATVLLMVPAVALSSGLGVWFGAQAAAHLDRSTDRPRDCAGTLLGSRASILVRQVAGDLPRRWAGIPSRAGHVHRTWQPNRTEAVQVAPRFFLAVLVAALFGPSLWYLALLLGLTFWPQTARLLRAQILSLRQREYVVVARAVGLTSNRILVRHVLPNAASVVVITAALQVGAAIMEEASLSFLGLGDRSQISWGYMLTTLNHFAHRVVDVRVSRARARTDGARGGEVYADRNNCPDTPFPLDGATVEGGVLRCRLARLSVRLAWRAAHRYTGPGRYSGARRRRHGDRVDVAQGGCHVSRVLIACAGNVLRGDDGFGVPSRKS